MTIRNNRDFLRRVSPYRFLICDNCGLERQQHPSPICDDFAHDHGDEPLAGMGTIHGTEEPLGDERHLRSVM